MLPYRATPIPLAAVALLLALWVFTASSESLTSAQCDADFNQLLNDIEKNRIMTIAEINRQLADEVNPTDPQGLELMREQAWDQEEQQRGQANYIWRDCKEAVKKNSS